MTRPNGQPAERPTLHRTSRRRALRRREATVARFRSRGRRRRALLLGLPAAFAVGAAVAVALATLAPLAVGGRSLVVMSDSMRPMLRAGDLVLARGLAPEDARTGDVVVFRAPDGSGRLITHRLLSIRIAHGVARVVTQGDANNTPERWSMPADGRLGRVVSVLPSLGRPLMLARSPLGWLVLVALPAAALALLELGYLRRLLRSGS